MFPISDSTKTGILPLFTISIIFINIAIFVFMIYSNNAVNYIGQYAFIPASLNFLNYATLIPLATSLFLHAGLLHLASNMWFLWVFGDNIEAHLGKIKFLIIYFASGIAGTLTQYLLTPESSIPMLGASGAVSGVMGAYAVLFPLAKIKSFLVLFFFITITNIPAFFYIFYWFFLQILSGIISLPWSLADSGGVAFWAHVGGFLAGLFITRYFKNKTTISRPRPDVIEGEIIE